MHPILVRFGDLTLHTYGVFVAGGFLVAVLLARREAPRAGIDPELILDLSFYLLIAALVGSRLFYVLGNWAEFAENPIDIIKFWRGGLVFYGGLVAATVVAIGIMKWHRMPVWKMADLISPLIAVGLSCGRIGCFLAGCCYGKETSLPWAVVFRNPDSLARLNVPLHPTQLYEAANSFVLFLFLSWMEKRKTFDGQIFWLFLLLYSTTRFFIEIFRGDPRGFLFTDLLSTSQTIGVLLAIFSLFMLFYMKKRGRRERWLFWKFLSTLIPF